MLKFTNAEVDFKIAPPESLSVIGSNSINTAGDLYVVHFNTISRSLNRRKKRMLDVLLSLFFLAGFPVLAFMVSNPLQYLRNIFTILLGVHSWVGYQSASGKVPSSLPRLKPGILSPYFNLGQKDPDLKLIEKINMLYAKDYKIWYDLSIVLKGFRKLGRHPDPINK
jgi:lipopolysaccharide/colanic/teichoic acid biosynthesis glycosyltransferase